MAPLRAWSGPSRVFTPDRTSRPLPGYERNHQRRRGRDLVYFTSPARPEGTDAFAVGLNYEGHIVLSSARYGDFDEGPGPISWVELSPGQARRLAHMLTYLAAKDETVPAHGA